MDDVRPRRRAWRSLPTLRPAGFSLVGSLIAAALLAGCDVLLVSPTLPGLLPGLGQPLHGQVLDADTGQPIGHATVMGDLGKGDVGWATTDNSGNFSLYGSISRHAISISRAGYMSVTYANGGIADGRQYFLTPLFPGSGNLHHTEAAIKGTVDVQSNGQLIPANALSGAVFLGGSSTTIQNGTFGFAPISANLPGNVYSGVLAGGNIGSGDPNGQFNFQPDPGGNTIDFDYQIVSIPFPDASSSTFIWTDPKPLVMGKVFAQTAKVSYSNVNWASTVTTEISLDFGLLGSVVVARQLSSQATVPIPSLANYKYILSGTAASADHSQTSQITIATNQPSLANFPLLSPPKPLGPANNAKGVGGHPVFSWAPVSGADSYVVKVVEEGTPPLPKWEAFVGGSTTAIGYPWFGDGDLNGGALLPGATYSWEVDAISASFEGTTPQALGPRDVAPAVEPQAGPIYAPYRKRTLESSTQGMVFFR